MCLPAAAVAIGQFVIGAVSSIAQYQQQQNAATYEEQLRQQDYQIRQRQAEYEYGIQRQQYDASQKAYNDRIEANRAAADRGYQREQMLLAEKKAEAAQRAQDLFIEKIQAQGTVLSSGRTGKSIALLTSDAEREYGRDLANLGTNLGYASQSYNLNVQDIYSEAESQNNLAASQRMFEPTKAYVPPPAAVMRPNATGLLLGIGESALGAASTYSALKAPAAGTGKIPKGDGLSSLNKAAKAYGG
jgi:hypothetical protein